MEELLTFLTEHKEIIVGATITLTEVVVVLINMYRKLKSQKKLIETMSANAPDFLPKRFSARNIFWAINPINLFRKP